MENLIIHAMILKCWVNIYNGVAQICDFHVPRNTICFPYIFFEWVSSILLGKTNGIVEKLEMVEV